MNQRFKIQVHHSVVLSYRESRFQETPWIWHADYIELAESGLHSKVLVVLERLLADEVTVERGGRRPAARRSAETTYLVGEMMVS